MAAMARLTYYGAVGPLDYAEMDPFERRELDRRVEVLHVKSLELLGQLIAQQLARVIAHR